MIKSVKPKVIFIMGATGTGKSKLSVDLATFFPVEIINSDKIQAYEGLDIVTNKLHVSERKGVPHHLLSFISDPNADFTVREFINHVHDLINHITKRGCIPIIVGGSNTYLEALVENDDNNNNFEFRSKYHCYFLWLDTRLDVLYKNNNERVDQMVKAGLIDEIRESFVPGIDYSRGIWRAIGVAEMEDYLMAERDNNNINKNEKECLLRTAIEETKYNTQSLVCRQVAKIRRLKDELQWEIQRIDATVVLEKRARGEEKKEVEKAWKQFVLKPSMEIVAEFLKHDAWDRRMIYIYICVCVCVSGFTPFFFFFLSLDINNSENM